MPSVPILPSLAFHAELAVQVVGVEPLGAEAGEDHLPVGGGRRGGVGAFAVAVVVGRALPRGLLPENLAGVAVERDDLEGVLAVGADAVGVLPLLPLDRVHGGLRAGDDRALDGRRDEDALAPDDRARMALARQMASSSGRSWSRPTPRGDSVSVETPEPSGPRHCGQLRVARRRDAGGRDGERGQKKGGQDEEDFG